MSITPDLLLHAYRSGIFPMAERQDDPEIFWVDPRRRGILPLDGFHISRSLARRLRRDTFRITRNTAFDGVMAGCADREETWINDEIRQLYRALFDRGAAHSIEVWEGDALVGGVYGVAFDRVFCGESMFSRTADASKVALTWLVAAMREAGYVLLDCQFMTEHLATMGAVAIPQSRYVELLAVAGGYPSAPLPDTVRRFGAASSPGKSILQSLTQTS